MKKGIIKRIFTLVICILIFASNLSMVQAKEAPTMEEMKSYLLSIGTPQHVLDLYTYESIEALKGLYETVYDPEGNISCVAVTSILKDGTKIDSISGIYPYVDHTVEMNVLAYVGTETPEQLFTKGYVNIVYRSAYMVSGHHFWKDLVAANWDPSVWTYNPGSLSYWMYDNFGSWGAGGDVVTSTQGGIGWKMNRATASNDTIGYSVFSLLPTTSNMYRPNNTTGYTKHVTSINAEYGWSDLPFGMSFTIADGTVSIDPSILFSGSFAESATIEYWTKN